MSDKKGDFERPPEPEPQEQRPVDAEQILRDFVESSKDAKKTSWKAKLMPKIEARLRGEKDRGYIQTIRELSRGSGADDERDQIVSAMMCYELDQIEQLTGDERYFNRQWVLRVALEMNEQYKFATPKRLGERLDRLSLDFIVGCFVRGDSKIDPKDLGKLVVVACQKSSSPEFYRENQATFKGVIDAAFKELLKQKSLFSVDRIFSPAELQYLMGALRQTHEEEYATWLFKNFDYAIGVFELKEPERIRAINDFFAKYPSVKMSFDAYRDQRMALDPVLDPIKVAAGIATAEEQRRHNERQLQLNKEGEEQKELEEARVMDTVFQKAKAYLDSAELYPSLFRADSPGWSKFNPLAIDPDNWVILRVQGLRAKSMNELKNDYHFFEEAYDRSAPAQQIRLDYETLRKKYNEYYEQRRDVLVASMSELISQHQQEIENTVSYKIQQWWQNKKSASTSKDIDEIEKLLGQARRLYSGLGEEAYSHAISPICQRANEEFDKIDRELVATKERIEGEKAREVERESREKILDIQKEYLLSQIGARTTYLRDLYAARTGLDLADVEGHGIAETSSSIGHVSTGMSLQMRAELRHELRLEVLGEQDGIYLDMGEDLESVRKRFKMVDWVGPHEVAHLVDQALDEQAEKLLSEKVEELNAIVASSPNEKRDALIEAIKHHVKESLIDGIGFRMVREHGVSDPFLENQAQILKATMEGLNATVDYFIENAGKIDIESHPQYAIIALRLLVVVDEFLQSARNNDLGDTINLFLTETQQKLQALFGRLNISTRLSDNQITAIQSLNRAFFRQADTLPFGKAKTDTENES